MAYLTKHEIIAALSCLCLSLLLFAASAAAPPYVSRQAVVFCFLLSVPFTVGYCVIFLVQLVAMSIRHSVG
ncbi:uncharacterized protein BO87DRAFT_380707 [Aspergillus neoniger CBS 115656]|uniref:Uncharacterized protein n=1 Tax=Aspergillus neoniger (strain CBS 115656) TaxID=1448310 RepID=A0A318Y681_ASPNB|nr:hypothetical protein BO87DRAFT_380707 [Aspergillus neoniger CBS 115656]PYH29384.1 hypothetical protein BO87DRAFT_380707 [Aspergillus neoniger CBS 115656]